MAAATLAIALSACSPTFDWRQNVFEGTGIQTSFPCRPDRHSRSLDLGGATVRMEMLVCSAGGATYAVGFFDAAEPAAVTSGLARLQAAMLANVGGGRPLQRPLKLPGLNAGPGAVRLAVDGRRPEGGPLHLEAAFFAKDLRVYQAAVVGPPLPSEAIEPFFDGLSLPS